MARNVRVGDVVRVLGSAAAVEDGYDLPTDTGCVVDIRGIGLLVIEDDDGVRSLVGVEDVVVVWARPREGVSHGA